jgi:hypothetical protein
VLVLQLCRALYAMLQVLRFAAYVVTVTPCRRCCRCCEVQLYGVMQHRALELGLELEQVVEQVVLVQCFIEPPGTLKGLRVTHGNVEGRGSGDCEKRKTD